MEMSYEGVKATTTLNYWLSDLQERVLALPRKNRFASEG
jgi:hypothetical protein